MEAGTVGYGCLRSEMSDDMHLFDDLFSMIVASEDDETAAVADAVLDSAPEQQFAPLMRPRCAHCAAELDGNLLVTFVEARRDDESTANVSVVYCGACGSALGARPTG